MPSLKYRALEIQKPTPVKRGRDKVGRKAMPSISPAMIATAKMNPTITHGLPTNGMSSRGPSA